MTEQDKSQVFNEMIGLLKSNYCGPLSKREREQKVIDLMDEYPEVQVFRDEKRMNIGMHCAIARFEEATIVALGDNRASLQQDMRGRNIGMYAAENVLIAATEEALYNIEASLQHDKNMRTIGLLALVAGISKKDGIQKVLFGDGDACRYR